MGTVWLLHLKANARVRHLLHTSTMASGLCHLCTNFVEGQSYLFLGHIVDLQCHILTMQPDAQACFSFLVQICFLCRVQIPSCTHFWTLIVLGWSVSHWKFGTYLWDSDTAMGFSLDQYLLFCLIMKFYLLELSSLHFKAILSCHYSTLHDLETSK